jgi:hypothetical protein
MSDTSLLTKAQRLPEVETRRIEIEIRRELLDLGVTPEEIQQQVELWLIVSLFKQGQITSAWAGELCGAGR